MFHNIKANLYFLYKESAGTIIIFWSIFLTSLLIFFATAVVLDGNVGFYLSTTIPVGIFIIIFGAMYVKETFPFAIKLGTTRVNFIISVLIYSLILAFVMASLNLLVVKLFDFLIERFSMGEDVVVTQFDPSFIEQFGNWQTFIYGFFMLLTFFVISLLFSMILYRFGYFGGGLTAVILLAFIFINQLREFALEHLSYVALGHENFDNVYLIFPPLVAFILFAILISRASVIGKIGKV